MADLAYEMNVAAARLARAACDKYSTPDKPRFVAGALGPDAQDRVDLAGRQRPGRAQRHLRPAGGGLSTSRRAALVEGGADVLLVETIFDTLNCKAALFAIDQYLRRASGPCACRS